MSGNLWMSLIKPGMVVCVERCISNYWDYARHSIYTRRWQRPGRSVSFYITTIQVFHPKKLLRNRMICVLCVCLSICITVHYVIKFVDVIHRWLIYSNIAMINFMQWIFILCLISSVLWGSSVLLTKSFRMVFSV